MTLGELKKLVGDNEEFEIILRECETDENGFNIKDFTLELCDVGHSDKVILLQKEAK